MPVKYLGKGQHQPGEIVILRNGAWAKIKPNGQMIFVKKGSQIGGNPSGNRMTFDATVFNNLYRKLMGPTIMNGTGPGQDVLTAWALFRGQNDILRPENQNLQWLYDNLHPSYQALVPDSQIKSLGIVTPGQW